MIKNHQLDAPEDFKGDFETAPRDHSELSQLYFNPDDDTRPLIMSDEERHRLHNERLMRQNTQLHRHVWSLTLQFATPLIALLYTVVTAFSFMAPGEASFFVAIFIGIGLLWYGLSQWAFTKFTRRLYAHNIRAGLFIVLLVVILGAASPLLIWLASFGGSNTFIQATIGAVAGFFVSLAAIKGLVCAATRSWRAAGQEG